MSVNNIENINTKRNKSFDLFLFVFFTAITFILYYSSVDNFFVLDDFKSLSTISSGALTDNFHFIPVPIITHRILYLIFGIDPSPVRILNLLVNSLFCFFVFKISYKLFVLFDNENNSTRIIKALLCSFLFSVHYIHVEAIVYFSELHELMYALFYLLGLYYYLSYRQKNHERYLLLVFLFYLLCFLSKETAVSLMLIAAASDIFLFKKRIISFFREFYPLFLITIFFIALRIIAFHKLEALDYSFGLSALISESAKNIIFTFTAFIVSLDFMLIKALYRQYGSNIFNTISIIYRNYPLALLGILISLSVYVLIFKKKSKIIYISFFFILFSILPFIWLVGYERYLYLPSVGLWIMLVHASVEYAKKNNFLRNLVIIIVVFLFVYNIYSLLQKKNNWDIASEISYNLVSEIRGFTKDLPPESVIYFKNLPGDYKGAWILKGFAIQELPALFLNRNDIYLYDFNDTHPELKQKNKIFIYDCKEKRLSTL